MVRARSPLLFATYLEFCSYLVMMSVYISYGGLLMRLTGDPRHWRDLNVGDSVYLLLRKL
jgi:RNA polymerase Rpb8